MDPDQPRKRKRFWIVALLLVIIGAAAAFRERLFHAGAPPAPTSAATQTGPAAEALPVEVGTVRKSRWQPYLETVGALTANNGVTVSTDLGGKVVAINFESGATVKKGDLLVQLDVERENAQLAAAEAKVDLSRLNLGRAGDLLAKHTIPQSEYDTASADFRQNGAAAQEVRSIIDKKTIRARFDGVTGIRQVNLGQYIDAGQPIVTLQSFDPIYVDFQLPQNALSQIANGRTVEVVTDAYPDVFHGQISAINSEVDRETRYVKVRATLANPNAKLRPGMFAKVNVQSGDERDVIAAPLAAVRYAPYGDSVFVVVDAPNAEGKTVHRLEQHFVKLGQSRGEEVAVTSGLEGGETVAQGEVFRLRNGAAVDPRPAGASAESAPADADHHS